MRQRNSFTTGFGGALGCCMGFLLAGLILLCVLAWARNYVADAKERARQTNERLEKSP